MVLTKNKKRNLTIIFSQGNFLLEEIVFNGKESRVDTIWLGAEEIEKINDFKMKMTGERS